jgi:hypothetical protein
MKNLFFVFALFLSLNTFSQGDLYLTFELMKVDNEQENAYAETENFWEKIHQQRVQNGDIIGWDLWSLQPSGEDQSFQYMTVTLYNSAKAMFDGGNFMENVKKAYPDMSDEELNKKFNSTAQTRDLAVRIFLHQIATTNDSFEMPLGTIAFINYMKANNSNAYEKAEMEVFQPMHQKEIDNGSRASWALLRFMLPAGSEAYATHIAVDMYKDLDQAFGRNPGDMGDMTEAQQKAVMDGIATRDLKWISMGTLIKKVR